MSVANIAEIDNRFTIESLEPRRLLAAWCLEPVLPPHQQSDISFYYTVDEAGYHWQAELGETGQPKDWIEGDRFTAYWDERLPSYDDAGPLRQDFYDALLNRLQKEHAWLAPTRPVEFSIVEFDDGTFEVIAAPIAQPDFPTPAQPVLPTDNVSVRADPGSVLENLGLLQFVAAQPAQPHAPAPATAAPSVLGSQDSDLLDSGEAHLSVWDAL